MPPKRRASGPQGKQATLAFHGSSNKVTKPRASPAGKAKATDKPEQNPIIPDSITETSFGAQSEPGLLDEPTTAELAIAQQARKEAAKAEVTPEEQTASKLSEAQIKKYWREKERVRKAPRVHQEGLGLYEKVLREFDTSGHYGPCIGITRTKRWKRAHRLGLNPPIEVLAVLLKEGKENTKAQRAHVDELMASRFIET